MSSGAAPAQSDHPLIRRVGQVLGFSPDEGTELPLPEVAHDLVDWLPNAGEAEGLRGSGA